MSKKEILIKWEILLADLKQYNKEVRTGGTMAMKVKGIVDSVEKQKQLFENL